MNTVFTVESFPLLWPENVARTERWRRQEGRFQITFAAARDDLLRQLELMGGRNIVINSNQPVRRDGLPMAVKTPVDDPGVAVYFTRNGQAHVIACDQYLTVLANLRGIGKTAEAIRGIERWGGKQMLETTISSFLALTAGKAWWEVLGLGPEANRNHIEPAYRSLARQHHPDVGGDRECWEAIQQAYAEALKATT